MSHFYSTHNSVLDCRSDTVTEISAEMRLAMSCATTGDMLYDEDKNVAELEEILSDLFQMSCIWTPSTTMSNLIAILLLKRGIGCEILVGQTSHINVFERKNASLFGGISYKPLPDYNGRIDLDVIQSAYAAENEFFPDISALTLENTHNLCGGRVFSADYLNAVCDWVKDRNMLVHIDGARIFNASVALNTPLDVWGKHPAVYSMSISLSKGLGTSAGAALLMRGKANRKKAKYIRKSLGGTMHTGAGYLAAAGVQLLQKGYKQGIETQLKHDHAVTKQLATEISQLADYSILNPIDTNIIYLTHRKLPGALLARRLQDTGVLCSCLTPKAAVFNASNDNSSEKNASITECTPVRFVIHRGILDKDINSIIHALKSIA